MALDIVEPAPKSPRPTNRRTSPRGSAKKQGRQSRAHPIPTVREEKPPKAKKNPLGDEPGRYARDFARANQDLEIANEELRVANEELIEEMSRRRQVERLSEVQRQLLQETIENLPAGVGVYRGRDHIIELVNPAYRAIAPGKVMEGRRYREVWPEVYSYVGKLLNQVLETGVTYRANDEKFTFKRSPDGPLETGYFSWSLVRIRLPGDDNWGILNTVIETTERKLAEERVTRLNQELTHRASELENATDQLHVANEELNLTNEELRAANEELHGSLAKEQATRADLERTNKELEDFTFAVSHDMRAPLNQINQLTEVITEEYAGMLDERGQHILQLIRSHACAVDNLAEGLLTLSRMTQSDLVRRRISMNDLVNTALDELTFAIKGRHVDIRICDLPPVDADPLLVKQIWLNLLSNSLKYTRHRARARIVIGSKLPATNAGASGDVKLAGATPSFGPTETVYFVRDNGVGFDTNQTDRLFRAFQRLHHAEEFEGHGLGLAMVDRIVRRHGGRVWAEGAIDRGATFYFSLGGQANGIA